MEKLVILGSSDAIPDMEHDTSHMLVISDNHQVLVDCSGSTFQKIEELEIPYEKITDIIITHFHPDHVSGLPMLLMDMWLSGRRSPLNIHGLDITINKINLMMDLYDWDIWPNMYQVNFNVVKNEEMYTVLQEEDLEIYASPVKHLIPTIGLRFEFKDSEQVITYSCDTEPCEAVVSLAMNSDVLIHEAAGELKGHTSISQAAEIASKAMVSNLYCIHYPRDDSYINSMIKEGKKYFDGQINLATDFMEFLLS